MITVKRMINRFLLNKNYNILFMNKHKIKFFLIINKLTKLNKYMNTFFLIKIIKILQY